MNTVLRQQKREREMVLNIAQSRKRMCVRTSKGLTFVLAGITSRNILALSAVPLEFRKKK